MLKLCFCPCTNTAELTRSRRKYRNWRTNNRKYRRPLSRLWMKKKRDARNIPILILTGRRGRIDTRGMTNSLAAWQGRRERPGRGARTRRVFLRLPPSRPESRGTTSTTLFFGADANKIRRRFLWPYYTTHRANKPTCAITRVIYPFYNRISIRGPYRTKWSKK